MKAAVFLKIIFRKYTTKKTNPFLRFSVIEKCYYGDAMYAHLINEMDGLNQSVKRCPLFRNKPGAA